jgi:hypothetical protein
MAQVSHFQVFRDWMFDGSKESEIPQPKYDEKGKEILPDILKYNSPIKKKYVMKMFIRHGPLNHYLNEYFNNSNFWKLDREEFLYFIKTCVNNLRLKNNDIIYFRSIKDSGLYNALIEKFPHLKSYEAEFICKKIEKSKERESVYQTLGLEVPKKVKIKKKKIKPKKVSLKQFLKEKFTIIR